MRRRSSAPKKYDQIDFTPPKGVAEAAAKGLELRAKASPSNRGGLTPSEASKQGIGSGVQRATNLKNRDTVSPKVIKQMRGFLSRSEKSSTISPENKGTPWNDKGYVAWLLWGGDPAKAWVAKVIKQMEAADEKEKQKTAYFSDVQESGGIKVLPQGQWEIVGWFELSDYMKDSVWEVYDVSYGSIGKHIPSKEVFGKKYKYLYLIDVDDDILPDAFIAYKMTHAGFKIALGGTDGTRKAKKAMILKMKELIRQPGWYAEASHKVSAILESAGARPIDDEEVVRKTLKGKQIEWLGDGKYSRQLGKSNISAAKSLYGTPRVAMQVRVARRFMVASENEPTNPGLWSKVQGLTKGEVKSITVNGKKIDGPNDGMGFTVFPSAYANGWASKTYKDLGGGWKKKTKKASPSRVVDRHFIEREASGPVIAEMHQSMVERPRRASLKAKKKSPLIEAWGSTLQEKTARKNPLDESLIKGFRKDVLLLAKAAERVSSLEEVRQVALATNKWREEFDIFTGTLRKDLEGRLRSAKAPRTKYNPNPPALADVEYFLERGGLDKMWNFASEVGRVPSGRVELKTRGGNPWKPPEKQREDDIQFWLDRGNSLEEAESFVDDYYRSRPPWTKDEAEAAVVSKWKEEARKWARRVRNKARPTWVLLNDVANWAKSFRGGEVPVEFLVPDEEVVDLSGFRVIFRGFAESPYQEDLPIIKEALKRFRKLAQARAPIILKKMVPIHIQWTHEPGVSASSAAYYSRNMIYVTPWVITDDIGRLVWVLAHEMGHHLYQTVLSGKARNDWSSFIRQTYTDLDLREVLRRLEKHGASGWVNDTTLKEKDPILYLQLWGLTQILKERLRGPDDIREYLEEGNSPKVRVMAMPISGYAHKNPEEAFCEALGKLVAYGPKAVPDIVLGMLRQVLPTVRISSLIEAWGSTLREARGKAKKDVGRGGLDEWFSGHGGAKGKGEDATWGDWVSISPVTKTLPSGKKVTKGDIVGECGISDDPDWKEVTKGGEDPLKCMPRQKAHDMPKAERAEKAKAKQKAEKADSSRGKKPTMTPTFQKEKGKKKASSIDRVFRSPEPFTGFRPVSGQKVGFKPKGLWYSCGSGWDDWCRYEMPHGITGSPYVYRIEVNLSRMLVIRNDDDFRDFAARYRIFKSGFGLIDWPRVARDYDGIEICPYQNQRRMSSDWYYGWDVASGCIWGSGAFKSVEPVETCGVEKSATVQRIQMKREATARLRSEWRGDRG